MNPLDDLKEWGQKALPHWPWGLIVAILIAYAAVLRWLLDAETLRPFREATISLAMTVPQSMLLVTLLFVVILAAVIIIWQLVKIRKMSAGVAELERIRDQYDDLSETLRMDMDSRRAERTQYEKTIDGMREKYESRKAAFWHAPEDSPVKFRLEYMADPVLFSDAIVVSAFCNTCGIRLREGEDTYTYCDACRNHYAGNAMRGYQAQCIADFIKHHSEGDNSTSPAVPDTADG